MNLICDTDKAIIREEIITTLIACEPDPPATAQLIAAIGTLVEKDFPEQWPDLPRQIEHLFQSQQFPQIIAASRIYLQILSIHHLNDEGKREQLITNIFPYLLQIAKHFVSLPQQTEQSLLALKIILKSYLKACRFCLPKFFQQQEVLQSWFSIFLQLLDIPCPPQWCIPRATPYSDREAERNIFWNAKKWACHSINKIFSRYGSTEDSSDHGRLPHFTKSFLKHFAVPCLECYIKMAKQSMAGTGDRISSRIVCLICDFLIDSLRPKPTWSIVQRNLEMLVTNFIFPHCCIGSADEELWENDPLEYVRIKMNPFVESYSATSSCTHLLYNMAKTRKNTVFMAILTFLNGLLNTYLQTPESSRDWRSKDGSLYMIGSLSRVIESLPIASQMESFLVTHVVPELQSKIPFLRARACWMLQQFTTVEYTDSKNALSAYQGVASCLLDAEIPVKMEAAVALGSLLEIDCVRDAIRPEISRVLQILIGLTNESVSDSLSYVMDRVVLHFPLEIAPFSVGIATQLGGSILRLLEEYLLTTSSSSSVFNNDEEPDCSENLDTIINISSLMKTVNTLIDAIKSSPEMLSQIEEVLFPIIVLILQRNLVDLFEELFEYLETVTFNMRRITPNMWRVFELVYASFIAGSLDYLGDSCTFFDNLISFGSDVFASSPQYQHAIYSIVTKTILSDDSQEDDRMYACTILESVLLNCKNRVDSAVPKFIDLATHLLETDPESNGSKVYYLQVITNALYYNASLAVSHLRQTHKLDQFFSKWSSWVDQFRRVHDCRIGVLSINEVLRLPLDSLSRSEYSTLLLILNRLLQRLPAAIMERKQKQQEFEDGIDADDSPDAYYEDEDEDEDLDAPDSAEIATNSTQAVSAEESYDDSYDEDDEDYIAELEEELFFVSTVDNIDPFITTKETLTFLRNSDSARFGLLFDSIPAEVRDQLERSLQYSQNILMATPLSPQAQK